MLKITLLAALLVVSGCADAKSSSSSSRSPSSYKSSSGYKSSSSYKSGKTSKPSAVKRTIVSVTNASRCSGVQQPHVEWDLDDREYEYSCHSGRKLNRNGDCECK